MENNEFLEDLEKIRKVNLEAFKPEMMYDKEEDIFNFIFCGKDKIEHTLEVGDFIRFDINKKEEVVGIEIENFSEFLDKAKCERGYNFENGEV